MGFGVGIRDSMFLAFGLGIGIGKIALIENWH